MKSKINLSVKIISVISCLAFLIFFSINNNFIIQKTNQNPTTLMKESVIEEKWNNRLQIQVLNGCGDKGVADLYTSYLRDNGLDVIDYKNADHFDYKNTIIIVHNNNLLVENIADLLQIDSRNIDYLFNNNIFYDLTIIIGKDYKSLNSYNDVTLHINPFE